MKFKIIIRRALIRLMLRYIIPVTLTVLALIGAIIAPINYYYDGSLFDLKRACMVIPFIIVFQGIAQFVSYKLTRWCSKHNI